MTNRLDFVGRSPDNNRESLVDHVEADGHHFFVTFLQTTTGNEVQRAMATMMKKVKIQAPFLPLQDSYYQLQSMHHTPTHIVPQKGDL